QPADEIGNQVGAQGPTGPEIPEHPGKVGDAREHHSPVGDRIGKSQLLAVDKEVDVAEHANVEARRGNDNLGVELLSGFEQDTRGLEPFDLVGYHRCLAASDALEQIGIRNEGDALSPGAITGREVRLDVVIGAKEVANDANQFLADD